MGLNTSQKFGGDWTQEKLNIFTGYLEAYLLALKNQRFKKIYIDAFAGTGEIETQDGKQYLAGSAKRALSANGKFDFYYFIENDTQKALDLQHMIDTEFSNMKGKTRVYCGDANDELAKIIKEIDWRNTRGLLFLDPYATQVNWTTLEIIARTNSIDVWYLFPLYALSRMLPRSGNYESFENCINRLLGDTGWQTEFYKDDPQISIFDLFPDAENSIKNSRRIKDANLERIKAYILSRLQTIFPCVSKNPRVFRNSKNSPLFLFCFAVSNKNASAQQVALRIADYILKNK